MSLTLAERERWQLELNRLARQGWADDKRRRVQAIQDATGWTFERSWDQAEREQQNPAPEPTSIGEAAKLVHAQHPTWTFQESWDYAEAVYPKLGKGTIQVMCQHALQTCGPSVIQYMPAGRTTLTPSVNGEVKQITVNVTPRTAARLQADLQKLLQQNVAFRNIARIAARA